MVFQPEIPRRQQDLVNTCFEEQLYDGGLGVLERIRTPDYLPPPQHIRQLLYLALYPPVTDWKEIKRQAVKRNAREKIQVSEIPPPDRAVVDLSLSTLHHLLRTNDARELLRFLPSYGHTLEEDNDVPTSNRLAYHAVCITRAKQCWEILKPNYILPEGCSPIPSKRSNLVADHAWGVFDWLVEAFERDAAREEGGVSLVLADQLPKSSGGPKTMMDVPLDIIFASFSEPLDQRRIDGGARLMTLLIALTKATPPLLSPDRLLGETCRRLVGMGATGFSSFLTNLNDSSFKHALACAFTSQHSEERGGPAPPGESTRRSRQTPQPTSRPPNKEMGLESRSSAAYAVQPVERVLEIIRLNARVQEDLAGDEEDDEEEGEEVPSITAKDQRFKHATMKLHLLGTISGLGVIKEGSWRAAVKDGRVKESIQVGFTFGGASDERVSAIGGTAASFGESWSSCL